MTTHLQTSAATVPTRDQFATGQTLFLPGIHLGPLAAVWHSNWAAVAVCLSLHAVFGGLGICVGYHRLLTPSVVQGPALIAIRADPAGFFLPRRQARLLGGPASPA